MKTIITFVLLLSLKAQATNLITDPANVTDNTVTPSGTGYVAMTINGTTGSQAALRVVNSHTWDAIQGVSTSGVGCYGHSDSFAGIFGESTTGNSGYFSSNSGSNTASTVVIQGIGGTANLLEAQDAGASVLASIDSVGIIHGKKGVQLDTTSSLPTCASGIRGLLYVAQGGAGVADLLKICMKNAANTYAWVTK